MVVEHLGDEERVAAGDRCSHAGSTRALTDEVLDRFHAERRQRQRVGAWRPGDVAEQRPQRVGDADLVVADDADDQRPGLRDAAEHEAQQVDGALVGPVQIVEDEHRRRSASGRRRRRRRCRTADRFAASTVSGGGRETVRDVVERAERSRRRQRIAGAPEHALVAHPAVDERLDEGRSCPRRTRRTRSPCRRGRRRASSARALSSPSS